MPDEFSVKLCNLVQKHPALYDIFNKGFHDEEAKTNAWQQISRELGVAQSKCVIKWKSLKHQYVKAKKEESTTWDLWPFLQFLDETTAAKSAPRKRKRESTATPMKMEIPATTDVEMPSDDSSNRGEVEANTTVSRSSRSTRTSSIYKETVITPAKSMFSSSETGTPLQSVATPRANPEKRETKGAAARTARSKRTSSANDTFGGLDADETGTPLQTMDTESQSMTLERSNKPSEPVPPPPTKGSTRRQGARAQEPVITEPISESYSEPMLATPAKGSTRRQSARVSLVPVDASVASTARQPNGASSGTPLKAAAGHSRGTAVASSATASMQPEVVLSRIPVPSNKMMHNERPAVPAATKTKEAVVLEPTPKKSPRKAAAASPAPPKARVSSTPRGRRSTRPPPAEAIPEEEEEDSSKVGPPQPKRQKIEGNGIGADDQADPLAGMTFDSMLDQKFFMQLKEKFTKLRPEVVSTMKASIFKMLDEAADS